MSASTSFYTPARGFPQSLNATVEVLRVHKYANLSFPNQMPSFTVVSFGRTPESAAIPLYFLDEQVLLDFLYDLHPSAKIRLVDQVEVQNAKGPLFHLNNSEKFSAFMQIFYEDERFDNGVAS